MAKKALEWSKATDLFDRLMYLRGALSEFARVEVPVDVRAEPFSAGDVTDEQLIVGARTQVLGLMEERQMLRLAVRELDACTWTWGHPPAGAPGAEESSWDLIEKARESVATAHKYRLGEAETPEVAAVRRELAELRGALAGIQSALDGIGAPELDAIPRILWLVQGYKDVAHSLDLAASENQEVRGERDALTEAIRWVTSAEDDLLGSVATGVPDLVSRLRSRVGRLLAGHEEGLNSLLKVATGIKRAKAQGGKVPPHEEGRLHALRDMDSADELARHALADVQSLTEQLDGARSALSRAYLFARAGASLSLQGSGLGQGDDTIDRMTGEQAFDVARSALLAIVAESRTWRAGR